MTYSVYNIKVDNQLLFTPGPTAGYVLGINSDGSTSWIQGGGGGSGTSGTSGTNGSSGTSGVSGADGSSGTSGISGSSGSSGINGLDGSSGTSGASGLDGTSGVNGIDGTSGVNGIDGTSGTSGVNGVDGTSGVNGADGTSGVNGVDGTSGVNGATGPAGPAGGGSSGTASVGFSADGGGSIISTGLKGYLEVPYSGTITGWTILPDKSGSCVIDIWKTTYAGAPPTVANTITGSAKPTLTSANKAQDSTLTGWTTSITAGDILAFNIDSASTITKVNFTLKINRS